jgi:hypothetical protein
VAAFQAEIARPPPERLLPRFQALHPGCSIFTDLCSYVLLDHEHYLKYLDNLEQIYHVEHHWEISALGDLTHVRIRGHFRYAHVSNPTHHYLSLPTPGLKPYRM